MRSLAERAAMIRKIVRLAKTPGMDEVAVKLNCEPTHDEIQEAKGWAKALELAAKDDPIFNLAAAYAGR